MVESDSTGFLKSLKIYDSLTKKQVFLPLLTLPIDLVLLDHDKTMTYKVDSTKPKLSLFLHPWAAETLKLGLSKGNGFVICSTAHVSRLIRQYRDGIATESLLDRLVIMAEHGSVIAIPVFTNKLNYEIYVTEQAPELQTARRIIQSLVTAFAEKKQANIFVNKDLVSHITIENFERKRELTDELFEIIKGSLIEQGILEKVKLSTGTFSIEIDILGIEQKIISLLHDIGCDNIISIGDSKNDVPFFKSVFGIQIPSDDSDINTIAPLQYAKLIAIGAEGGGTTTSQLILHLVHNGYLKSINIENFKEKLRNEIISNEYKMLGTIDPTTIKSDYTLPQDLDKKSSTYYPQEEKLLKQIYPPLNLKILGIEKSE
jgi:hypothetical protein